MPLLSDNDTGVLEGKANTESDAIPDRAASIPEAIEDAATGRTPPVGVQVGRGRFG